MSFKNGNKVDSRLLNILKLTVLERDFYTKEKRAAQHSDKANKALQSNSVAMNEREE